MMTMVIEEKMIVLAGEILTFGLLGKLLYQYPEKEFYRQLIDERIFDEIPLGRNPSLTEGSELIRSWMRENEDIGEDGWFDDLLSDYTRLFIGPDKVLAPPWESVFVKEGRLVFTETTLDVRHWYRRFGLESENVHREPDDHIGLELIFTAHLAGRAAKSLESGDLESYVQMMQAQADFYHTHLGNWATRYFNQLYDYARTDFYRGIALLGRGAMNHLESVIGQG